MTANALQQRWRRLLVGLVVAELIAVAVNRSVIRVRGTSMLPALWPGDLLLTVPAAGWRLRPGLVVIVTDPADPAHRVVKRLTAIGRDGSGRAGVEVHGDNPAASTDSRAWGVLPRQAVRRVALRRWPDVRTRLAQPGRRATISSSGSSSATSPDPRRA